jgi:hypothetical protein
MKTKTYSQLSLAGCLLVSAMLQPVNGQENGKAAESSSVAERALQYFEKTGKGDLGEYLRSIRPAGVSADRRARLVASIKRKTSFRLRPRGRLSWMHCVRSSRTTTELASKSRF